MGKISIKSSHVNDFLLKFKLASLFLFKLFWIILHYQHGCIYGNDTHAIHWSPYNNSAITASHLVSRAAFAVFVWWVRKQEWVRH